MRARHAAAIRAGIHTARRLAAVLDGPAAPDARITIEVGGPRAARVAFQSTLRAQLAGTGLLLTQTGDRRSVVRPVWNRHLNCRSAL